MRKGKSIRIVIADDHTVVRDGLAAILGMQDDMQVVAEAADGEEACAAFERHRPDVLLLDLRMPKKDGFDVVQAIRAKHREARIVIITTYAGDEDIFRSLNAGAIGYLLKDAPRQEIIDAVRTAFAGRQYLPAALASKVVERALKPQLSQRETEVLQRIATGQSNKEIAAALFVGEGTIKTHVKSILGKLDAASRTEAVAIASRRGLARVHEETPSAST
jgi:two-component system NarL family response regulator